MVGFAGVGKTTFSKRLESETKAIRFTPDELVETLYGDEIRIDDFLKYFARVSDLVWSLSCKLLQNEQDVILDIGFWSRASREEAKERLSKIGADYKMYYVTCAEEEIKRRLLLRNSSLWADEKTIIERKALFEEPNSDEDFTLVKTCT